MLTLDVLAGDFSIHRLAPGSDIPPQVTASGFYSVSRTADELSIVCRAEIEVAAEKSEPGWTCLKVLGPLDFALTGILSGIAATLAKAGISLFAISTFDTDYILVRVESLERAVQALVEAGYQVQDG